MSDLHCLQLGCLFVVIVCAFAHEWPSVVGFAGICAGLVIGEARGDAG